MTKREFKYFRSKKHIRFLNKLCKIVDDYTLAHLKIQQLKQKMPPHEYNREIILG